MKSKLAILLVLSVLTLESLAGNSGTPPQPLGDKTRFVLVEGVDEFGGKGKTMYRMDTFTGECWMLLKMPLISEGQVVSHINYWCPLDEIDGEAVKIAIANFKPAE